MTWKTVRTALTRADPDSDARVSTTEFSEYFGLGWPTVYNRWTTLMSEPERYKAMSNRELVDYLGAPPEERSIVFTAVLPTGEQFSGSIREFAWQFVAGGPRSEECAASKKDAAIRKGLGKLHKLGT